MRVHGSWLVVLAVLSSIIAVPSLREIWNVMFRPRVYASTIQIGPDFEYEQPLGNALGPYAPEATYFVDEHAPERSGIGVGRGADHG